MARLSATIASPLAVLTLLPLLVASIGLFLTWVGQRSLRVPADSQLHRHVVQSDLYARSVLD